MTRSLFALLAATALASSATAATLRPLTTLDAPVVRLSDLFDDAGPGGERVLGPGPGPGARIVVEAPQLAAIARQFGLDWRPASPTDRAVLDRPGRLLPREDVVAALRSALTSAGAPDDAEIDLPGFAAPLVATESHPRSTMEQLDYDAASGRFTGLLAVTGDGMPMLRMRLSGTLQEMIELPVPVRRLLPGSIIQPGDLRMTRLRAGLARGEVVRNPAQAVGLTLRRQAVAGQPLPLAELTRPAAVQKGARVTMQLQAPGLTLLAQGQALEAGAIGDRIQVLNPASRAVVEADVTGPDRVRVAPGTLPLQPAGGRPFQYSSIAGRLVQ
ncbi:flagellar basal body P-ring formation chaperone FlgA [Limobrevibacterium gyesilva]|uniref:Flagellar basal body P-ring formation chaperone FlgA n=1 Tax=Limobrevibacterium gyesilva TaxID=2991712 RepID=A0AA41YMM0_9PROT|nr:flagellar basal body P-ring formation chaperone FlgA [Limobrevibacterium gyesilva]MCW3475117.1 flagellar basal body P-ring formation chaperone FlgA [Limobrevibacterium gyesilva]